MDRPNRPRRESSLRRDFAIFADMGFLATLAIVLGLFAIATAVLLYTSREYGIWPLWRFTMAAATSLA